MIERTPDDGGPPREGEGTHRIALVPVTVTAEICITVVVPREAFPLEKDAREEAERAAQKMLEDRYRFARAHGASDVDAMLHELACATRVYYTKRDIGKDPGVRFAGDTNL